MKVLLDTCTIAEIRLPNGQPSVKAAVARIPADNLYLSVLSMGEIWKGIAMLAAGRKKSALSSWIAALEVEFTDRILEVDLETTRIWGELTARAQKTGITIHPTDGLLAATALRHGLHVMTRNTRHFQATGALILDPWQGR